MAQSKAGDHLALDGHKEALAMIKKEGVAGETVQFSDFVIKINKRGKEQTRVLLLTNKALYNVMPKDYSVCKRRINLKAIIAVTASSKSDEFVVHIPDEYDYRYKSTKKKAILTTLKRLATALAESEKSKSKLAINYTTDADLKALALTKGMAQLQTREERMRRRTTLVAGAEEDDEEDRKEAADAKVATETMKGGDPNVKVGLTDFELLKVLGRGAFGKVMQVRKKDTGKIYAMKILKKKELVAKGQIEHTKAERDIMQKLSHPFLMTLRFAFQSPEKLYFVMDYFRGGELFFHLKKNRRFTEDVARLYIAEIGLALGHLHSLGVVYRDLKPENILLDENGFAVLTDFGLSKELAPDDPTQTFCGTPEYLAPEIIKGKGYGPMVDWWSLGILLYELCVGIPPFYSQNVNEMYQKIQNGVLRFPPFTSTDCKGLIIKLLHRNPTKRLGCNKDIEEIKAHPFFNGLDWEKLMKREIVPAYKPQAKGDTNTDNFETTFTSEPVVDTYVADSALGKAEDAAFQGFTFEDKDSVMPGKYDD